MAASTARPIQTELKPEALGLVGVTMQAITHIAPAIAALFFTQFLVTLAGITAPLAYVVAVILVLMLGNTLIQFSRQLPSAGGYYTYVSRALGPRAGFLTSWMFILYSPMAGGVVCGFFGFIVAGELKAAYGVDLPWLWAAAVILGAGTVAFLQYRGVNTRFGLHNIKGIQGSPDLPGLALAHKLWGAGWVLILLAFLSSTLAVTLATANVSTRMWYSMGRNGAFPKIFARVHPKYKTPTNAIFAQMILTLGSGLIAGAIWNSQVAFFLLSGLVLVIGVAFVYLMANVGVIVYYWQQRRSEFSWFFHGALPVLSSLVLLYALAQSYPPLCPAVNCPVDPYLKAPLVDIGWLIIGVLILVYYTVTKREQWLKTAGASLGESEDDLAMAKVLPVGESARVS